MRAFVTGSTGFIGGALARRLLDDGADVTLLVRSPERAVSLRDRGAALHVGDVTEAAGLAEAMKGHDVVFHLAAWYALGARDRARMIAINVGGTETVVRAAADAGVAKVVYCSSIAAMGPNREGEVGDETQQRTGEFGSIYEETKFAAHELVRAMAADGVPALTVLPCAVYGPGDTSLMGMLVRWYANGRLWLCPLADAKISYVHVDDVASGVLGAGLKGRPGEDYILGGENVAIHDMFRRAEPVTGIKAPRLGLSSRLLTSTQFLSPLVARIMRQEPDFLRDAAAAVRGSWHFSSAKAERELGYTWRTAAQGLADTVAAFRA